MKKRVLSLALALALVLSLCSGLSLSANASAWSGTYGDDITWSFDEDSGLLSFEGEGPLECNDDPENLPWASYKSSTAAVSIAEGITSIGADLFSDYVNMTSVTLPTSLTSIGERSFCRCSSLTGVTIPDGVTDINAATFSECSSLLNVTIPDSVTAIYAYAFSGCSSLTDLTIPDSVTDIGKYAFSECRSLRSLTIPDSVTSMDEYVFSDCSGLTSVTIPGSLTEIVWGTFCNCSALTSVTIPEGVTFIGFYAFANCSALKNVTFPDGLVTIGADAFSKCTALTSVTIPSTVIFLQGSAFAYCSGLTSITLPASVKSIDSRAFFGCTSLRSVTIPDSVTSIGRHAFTNCTALTSITIPASVTSIEEYAFGWNMDEASFFDELTKREDVTICGYNDTAAQTYAEENGVRFVSLDDAVGGFLDVEPGSYYTNAVLWAVNHEPRITSGTSLTSFSPGNSCARAQIITFLWHAMGDPEPVREGNPFTDLSPSAYYYRAVLWAYQNGITSGVSAHRFGAAYNCTRAQAVTFLWRAKGEPQPTSTENPFLDIQETDYYYTAVLWAVENNITSGIGNNCFGPNRVCTRAQIVTFLYQAFAEG